MFVVECTGSNDFSHGGFQGLCLHSVCCPVPLHLSVSVTQFFCTTENICKAVAQLVEALRYKP
jgi:hypothetical protein